MNHTTRLHHYLNDLNMSDTTARDAIIEHTCERLRLLTSRMLRGFVRVKRWSETDDVLQNAMIRLHHSLAEVKPETSKQFYGLAATQIRRELVDLARHYYGAEGLGANHHTDDGILSAEKPSTTKPETLEAWTRFHTQIEQLPEEQRDVIDLLWYEGVSQPDAAKILNVSLATVKRRWQATRLSLFNSINIDDFK